MKREEQRQKDEMELEEKEKRRRQRETERERGGATLAVNFTQHVIAGSERDGAQIPILRPKEMACGGWEIWVGIPLLTVMEIEDANGA